MPQVQQELTAKFSAMSEGKFIGVTQVSASFAFVHVRARAYKCVCVCVRVRACACKAVHRALWQTCVNGVPDSNALLCPFPVDLKTHFLSSLFIRTNDVIVIHRDCVIFGVHLTPLCLSQP